MAKVIQTTGADIPLYGQPGEGSGAV